MLVIPSRDPIVVEPHNPIWAGQFKEEYPCIVEALGDRVKNVHHIGSTSIPGLQSKPIIDIMVSLAPFEDPHVYSKLLASAGYAYASHGSEEGRIFFIKITCANFHLHLVEDGEWMEKRHTLFRDALTRKEALRTRYEELKRELATRFRDKRASYVAGKTAFIEQTAQEEKEYLKNM